jgi:hypothetical protein
LKKYHHDLGSRGLIYDAQYRNVKRQIQDHKDDDKLPLPLKYYLFDSDYYQD